MILKTIFTGTKNNHPLELTIANILLLIGLAQGLLLSMVLLTSPLFQTRPNRYLAWTFLTLTLMGFLTWRITVIGDTALFITLNDIMWELVFPVFLLFYFAYSFDHSIIRNKNRYWLYVPFCITLLLNVAIDLDEEYQLFIFWLARQDTLQYQYYTFEQLFTMAWVVSMFIWAYLLIRKYERESDNPRPWFRQFWVLATIAVSLWVLFFVLEVLVLIDLYTILWFIVTGIFYWITYRGVFQLRIREEAAEIHDIRADRAPTMTPIASGHPQFDRLDRLMQDERLFENPELNRELVAERLGISPGYLSQVLKDGGNISFPDYLNGYRVAAAKSMLTDPEFQSYNVLSIGLEAGFKSKSTYYAAFKKETGLSPSAFQKTHVQVRNPQDLRSSDS